MAHDGCRGVWDVDNEWSSNECETVYDQGQKQITASFLTVHPVVEGNDAHHTSTRFQNTTLAMGSSFVLVGDDLNAARTVSPSPYLLNEYYDHGHDDSTQFPMRESIHPAEAYEEHAPFNNNNGFSTPSIENDYHPLPEGTYAESQAQQHRLDSWPFELVLHSHHINWDADRLTNEEPWSHVAVTAHTLGHPEWNVVDLASIQSASDTSFPLTSNSISTSLNAPTSYAPSSIPEVMVDSDMTLVPNSSSFLAPASGANTSGHHDVASSMGSHSQQLSVVSPPDSHRSHSPARSSRSVASSNTPDVLQCGDCSATFKGKYRSGNLSRHGRQKHRDEEIKCSCEAPGCMKTFMRKDARLKHYRVKHPHLATPYMRRTQLS